MSSAVVPEARILRLPITSAGRQLLRASIVESGGPWDFPDGSAAETIDWDLLAVEIDRMLSDVARLHASATHRGIVVPG